jgi:hypothetical protein
VGSLPRARPLLAAAAAPARGFLVLRRLSDFSFVTGEEKNKKKKGRFRRRRRRPSSQLKRKG